MITRLIQAIVAEVRRRKVFRAVVLYAIGAWVVLQVGDLTFEPLGFPNWSMQALILAVIIGFPLVFLLTWCIDLGPRGFMFDLPLWRGLDPDHPRSEGPTDLVILLSLILLLGAGIYGGIRLFVAEIAELEQSNMLVEEDETPRPNSIAVLSFASYTGDQETDHFANGLAEEILYLLANIDELAVAARTSSFQHGDDDDDTDAREIARVRVSLFSIGMSCVKTRVGTQSVRDDVRCFMKPTAEKPRLYSEPRVTRFRVSNPMVRHPEGWKRAMSM